MADKRERKSDERPGDRHRPRHMVSVPPDLWRDLKAEAETLGCSVTFLVRSKLKGHRIAPAATIPQ